MCGLNNLFPVLLGFYERDCLVFFFPYSISLCFCWIRLALLVVALGVYFLEVIFCGDSLEDGYSEMILSVLWSILGESFCLTNELC